MIIISFDFLVYYPFIDLIHCSSLLPTMGATKLRCLFPSTLTFRTWTTGTDLAS